MTAKTLEKSPVFVHPLSEGIYSVDELSTSLTVFPSGDAPAHYEHMSAGKSWQLYWLEGQRASDLLRILCVAGA